MAKLDISTLKGDELFAALSSGKKITIKTEVVVPVRRPDLWKSNALVLIVHKTYCKCGMSHEFPNPHILLRRKHPVDGIHYSAIEGAYDNPPPSLRDLPLVREDIITQVTQCQWCWNIEQIIDNARKQNED